MNVREVLSRLNRLQHSMPFKVVASVVVVALAVAAFTTYFVMVTAPGAQAAAAEREFLEAHGALDAGAQMLLEIGDRRATPLTVALGVSILSTIALTVVWLGLGLSYLALFALAIGVALPLSLLGFPGSARMLAGIVVLTAAFMALLQGLRLLFSGPGPVMGIARNVLVEAVRMKVALVFIVLLIFAMAALPGLLDPSTPLRYRVQSFLQYGTGGSYWIIAILVVFFSVGTVAFEQRDRQIWQTMTKPVAAWQYILGKWLGVMGLSAALLAVCCAGVFLFTEYLRQQPAVGEDRQYVMVGAMPSEDRLILETQVLAARRVVEPMPPISMNDPDFLEGVRRYILDRQASNPSFGRDRAHFEQIKSELYTGQVQHLRSIAPGHARQFRFEGLQNARDNEFLTLRYRIDSAGNPPGVIYKLSFVFNGQVQPPQSVSLGPSHTTTLHPDVIAEDGSVTMEVYNGELLLLDQHGTIGMAANDYTLTFPPGGLQLSYSAGSYQMNFLRVAAVLWLKLAFLAIVGIATGTFLSFPVACLVAFSVFIAAEGAGFLATSVEYYDALDHDGNIVYWKIPVRAMGLIVSAGFKTYAELRPTMRLVDGILLSWQSIMWGLIVLAAWSAVLYTTAVAIFRRRELATYSGQ